MMSISPPLSGEKRGKILRGPQYQYKLRASAVQDAINDINSEISKLQGELFDMQGLSVERRIKHVGDYKNNLAPMPAGTETLFEWHPCNKEPPSCYDGGPELWSAD